MVNRLQELAESFPLIIMAVAPSLLASSIKFSQQSPSEKTTKDGAIARTTGLMIMLKSKGKIKVVTPRGPNNL
ncbi:Uncharacterised protein [Chlamydia abortus]|nr:Uncharacterised protein [Chlamydia abortus]